ncbi:TPA: hypothetical protein ACH3X2_007200 [Trebouxia sp. C0005]
MDTRGRSQSPLEITVKGNGMQHVGDKGTKNRSCSPQSIAEDPSDGAEAKMRAMSEEVVDVPSPKKLVVDHSAAFSAGHASQQMQASAQVPAAAEQLTRLTDSLEEMHQGMLTLGTMAPAVDMETFDHACIDLTEDNDMDEAPAAGAAQAQASTAAASTSEALSAAASAEAARVKHLEAQLAQIQAQASKLEAQNLQLASELEKAQQVSQEGARMASLVQPPPFWQAHAQGQAVLYVELPIPLMSADAVVATSGISGDVQLGVLHKTWINDMRTNGVELHDALAALRKHKGDEDAALGLVLEASGNGGVMKYLQLVEGLCTVPPPMQPVADACDRELEAETEMVMGWWEKHGGLSRSLITSIRRVQNQPLWTKYALKRAEIQEVRADSHETWLFHGAHKTCIELIAAKGFDIRVSRHGTLGQGTYFANCSAYSDRYARMGSERAVGAGFTSSVGVGAYRSMLRLQHHQLRAQRQQQQQQQAGQVSVDPSGMSGPHALLTSGPPQVWPGNAPVRSAAQAALEAAAQATAAAVHLQGPAAYSYPFQMSAADAVGRLPHGLADHVQQQREQLRQAKCVTLPAAGPNAGSAGRPEDPAAVKGTGATSDGAFAEDISKLRQHRFRQIPPRQISEVPAASTAPAEQPDQVGNTCPDSSAGVGVPTHLPNSGLAEQHETDRFSTRKRSHYGQREAALTSAFQHDRFSEGAQLSGSFQPPNGLRLLPQGSEKHLNVQLHGTVGPPKGQSGAMPPPAPCQSADRGTDRQQSLQHVPASRWLVDRWREDRMLRRLQKGQQPPCASDQQPIEESCNTGLTPRALNGGAGSTHTAEGSARPLRHSCDSHDGQPNLSHMLPTCSSAPFPDPDPAPVMFDNFTTGQTALQAPDSGRQRHTVQTDLPPATTIFAGPLPCAHQHRRQAQVPARMHHSRHSDLTQPWPDAETQLATTYRRARDRNSQIVPHDVTADLEQDRLTHAQGFEQNKACCGQHQGPSSLSLFDMLPQHCHLPETAAAAAEDAAMVKGGEEDKQQQLAQSAPMSRAGNRVRFADTATVGDYDDTASTQQQQQQPLLPKKTDVRPLSPLLRLPHAAAAELEHVSQDPGDASGHVRSRRPFTRGQADARTDRFLSASDEPQLPPAAGSRRPYSQASAITTAAAGEAASGKVTKDILKDDSQRHPVDPVERESGRPSKRRKLNLDHEQANRQRGDVLSQLQGKQEGYSRPERHANGIPGINHDSRAHGQVEGQGRFADWQNSRNQDVLQRFDGHQASRHLANGQNDGQSELSDWQIPGHHPTGDGHSHKRGSRHGHKGKGSPSQTADTNGPAEAVLLGSSLNPAANEVTSKAAADHSLPSSGTCYVLRTIATPSLVYLHWHLHLH